MEVALNIPYVKKYDENGEIVNEIKGSYVNNYPNRRQRREGLNQIPFCGNSKNHHLTINGVAKYRRVLQVELDKEGNKKYIEHYLLKTK